MAAYLALVSKADGSTYTGRDLIKVDDMLCAHVGVEPDPECWHMGWMDWVGFSMAVSGKPVADALSPMLPNMRADERKVVQWFIDNFENASFYGR